MKKRDVSFLLSLLVGILLFLFQKTNSSVTHSALVTPPAVIDSEKFETAELVKVVDGDTVRVKIDNTEETIRIIGINTPETVDPRKPVECLGKEASQFAQNFFSQSEGKVLLQKDESQGERDKYSRLLRYVMAENTKADYGEAVLSEGYANEYTYEKPYNFQEKYRKAEEQAKNEKKGLWADDACGR